VHNGENYLESALESLLGQEGVDLEVVAVDNGSVDRTPEILERFARADPRLRVERSEANRGAAWSFNRTFELSRGRFFSWSAHDDIYEPEFSRRCLDRLEADPGLSVVVSEAVMIDDRGRVKGPLESYRGSVSADPVRRGLDIMFGARWCLHVFGVSRRETLARTRLIGAYPSSDMTTLFELALEGRFGLVPDVLFLNREHPGRSMRAHGDSPRDRDAWFDPDRAGRNTLPRWRLLVEYERSIRRSELSGRDKARLRARLPLWALDSHNRRTLAAELAGWVLRSLHLSGPVGRLVDRRRSGV